MKQPIQLEKITHNIDLSDDNVRVKGAKFKIYQVSKLDVDYNATYVDIMNKYYNKETHKYEMPEEAIALNFSTDSNGTPIPEIVTGEDGIAVSELLAYGRYVVIETTNADDVQVSGEVETGLELARPFFVKIETDSETPLEEKIITDPHMTAFIKVEKRDRITGKIVKIHGAKYLINKITTDNQEIDGEVLTREPIIQTVAYPNEVRVGTEENPYTTTDEGTFTTPLSLNVGILPFNSI